VSLLWEALELLKWTGLSLLVQIAFYSALAVVLTPAGMLYRRLKAKRREEQRVETRRPAGFGSGFLERADPRFFWFQQRDLASLSLEEHPSCSAIWSGRRETAVR
jgi:hypothetical protein